MKICGLITEYNPFHEGHKLHIEQALRLTGADCLIAVMSGSFVQRGEPAIMDKFGRARQAVKNGIDIVVELPMIYATSDAGGFATGAVKILNALKADDLVFGSSLDNVNILTQLADILLNEDVQFKSLLIKYQKQGNSYPLARLMAVESCYPNISADSLNNANTLLGLEYIMAIKSANSLIKPHTYIRQHGFSATACRKKLLETYTDAENTADEYLPLALDDFSTMLGFKLLDSDYSRTYGLNAQLYNTIKNNAHRFTDINSFLSLVKSKNLTMSHIKRAMLHILFNISVDDFELISKASKPSYIRLLAVGEKGRSMLGAISDRTGLKIITNPNQISQIDDLPSKKMLKLDILATSVYNMVVANKYSFIKNEYTTKVL